MGNGLLKALSIGATLVGAAATVVNSIVGQKQQEAKIEEAAVKAVSDLMSKEG